MQKDVWEDLREAGFVRDVPHSLLSSTETAQFEKIVKRFYGDSDLEGPYIDEAITLAESVFEIDTPFVLFVHDTDGAFQCIVGEDHKAGSDAGTIFYRGVWKKTRMEALQSLTEVLICRAPVE